MPVSILHKKGALFDNFFFPENAAERDTIYINV